ncbi:MAG TPA: adenylate/guanylate cyclase domain-containing protein [Acidimicrobiia bacterium]
MTSLSPQEAAESAGVETEFLDRLVQLGILAPAGPDSYSKGDVRRVVMARSLEEAGIPLASVVEAIQSGSLSLDFLDAPAYERFTALTAETLAEASERTGIPFELLSAMREALGLAQPTPDSLLREDELDILPFLEIQVNHGFSDVAVERLLRVYGDSTRRITEAEGAWWTSEVIEPAIAAGESGGAVANSELANQTAPLAQQAILAIYHSRQARIWTANIIDGFESLMAQAGIRSRLERMPAICFLDIVGYTRLTQELGDVEAAALAAEVAKLVERSSVRHEGRTIKWLGDGVMFFFPDPGAGVAAALEMVDALAAAGLPPAHVGLDAGPVLYQQGDYFGQTVNVAARIADYARPREILVSQAVADASSHDGIEFHDIGDVELKGVSGTVHLLQARSTPV